MDAVTLDSTLVALGALGGILVTYYKLKDKFKEEVVAEITPAILRVENRVSLAEQEIQHLKQTHAKEIVTLAKKLDELRDEVRAQHSQLIELLMKFVPDPKKKI
jgi:hypothetical protein